MKRSSPFLFLSFFLAAALVVGFPASRLPVRADAASDAETAMKIVGAEKTSPEIMTNLEYLSDVIGPRLTGSARLKRANDWTAAKMREYGLDNVHLESYTIPQGWERGRPAEATIINNGLPLPCAQLAWSPGTRGKVEGQVVVFNPTDETQMAAYKGKLKDAIVLLSDRSRPVSLPDAPAIAPIPALAADAAPPADAPTRGAPNPAARAFRRTLAKFMQDEGVAAILQDSGKPHELLNMTGSWSSQTAIPTLFVSHEGVAMLLRLMKRPEPVRMAVKMDGTFIKGPVTVYNTVGDIRGTEKPDEVVILGAHLDSWDLGTGSTDNGTGSMAVLEAARLLKTAASPPKRTVRFILFSGEEEGLNGSKAYVDAHKAEMGKFSVVFIHDTGTGRVKGLWLQNRAESRPLLSTQFNALKTMGLLTDEPNLLPGKMNGTDHASFDDAGVPAFAFNQDSAEYSLTHHSQSDTFDKVREGDLKQGACVLAILAHQAADMADAYPRSPGAAASR